MGDQAVALAGGSRKFDGTKPGIPTERCAATIKKAVRAEFDGKFIEGVANISPDNQILFGKNLELKSHLQKFHIIILKFLWTKSQK